MDRQHCCFPFGGVEFMIVPNDTILQSMSTNELKRMAAKFGPYDVCDGTIRLAKELRYRNRDKIAEQQRNNGPSMRMQMRMM